MCAATQFTLVRERPVTKFVHKLRYHNAPGAHAGLDVMAQRSNTR